MAVFRTGANLSTSPNLLRQEQLLKSSVDRFEGDALFRPELKRRGAPLGGRPNPSEELDGGEVSRFQFRA